MFTRPVLGGLLVTALYAGVVLGQAHLYDDLENDACLDCHDGATEDIPGVTEAHMANSVHADFLCVDCHSDIQDIPHDDELAPAACGDCHDYEVESYTSHGRGVVGETEDLPSCADCHGSHDIRPVGDEDSWVHPNNLAETCGHCHNDLEMATKHEIRIKDAAARFELSVHSLAGKAGLSAPSCTDCHGTDNTAHNIKSPHDPESSTYHFNIPETCGQCHGDVREEYEKGIHGKLVAQGDVHSPVCTDCHGEHGILPIADPRSNVNPSQVARSTCEPCHESARINEAYGGAAGEIISFVDSYHGLKSRSGDRTVANCASCHEAHAILPSSDPASSTHPQNLKETCGSCHPGITAEFASIPIHTPLERRSQWPGYVANIYIWLIILVIGGMAGFVVLDFIRGYRKVLAKRQVRRMSANAVLQHTLLMVSFIVLVYTGFALRYSEGWLFNIVFGWDGGFHLRGIIHRVAGCVFMVATLWHVVYLFTPTGRRFLKDIAPGPRDMRELREAIFYNLGRSNSHPRYGRFSFAEKAEYWALVWGTIVMMLTGLLLWFDPIALKLFSRTVLDVFRVIHLYEAWLAALAIVVWHLYGVMLKPGVYPGNPAWLTGTMPEDMHAEEHPGEASEGMPKT